MLLFFLFFSSLSVIEGKNTLVFKPKLIKAINNEVCEHEYFAIDMKIAQCDFHVIFRPVFEPIAGGKKIKGPETKFDFPIDHTVIDCTKMTNENFCTKGIESESNNDATYNDLLAKVAQKKCRLLGDYKFSVYFEVIEKDTVINLGIGQIGEHDHLYSGVSTEDPGVLFRGANQKGEVELEFTYEVV